MAILLNLVKSANEKLVSRRKNVRLVAEVVRLVAEVAGDRKGQISRGKIVVMFKTQSHRAYDQVTTYLRPKNWSVVERTYDWLQRSYDWSQRSRVIARGKSVAGRSWSCSKPSHTGLTTRLRPICDRKMLQSCMGKSKKERTTGHRDRTTGRRGRG